MSVHSPTAEFSLMITLLDRMVQLPILTFPAIFTPLPSTQLSAMAESWPIWLSAMMKQPLPMRVPPSESMPRLMIHCSRMRLLSPM